MAGIKKTAPVAGAVCHQKLTFTPAMALVSL